MNKLKLTATALAASMTMFVGNAIAHSGSSVAGGPVCIESNIMMADAMNADFSNNPGPGRVLEMNITTGERGITVNTPFSPLNAGDSDICPDHVECPGPFKPTGILSGGEDGHAFLVSAANHSLTEHHRDGTAIKTNPLWPTDPSPTGAMSDRGFVPRLLGNGFMPNGNIVQTSCDANFFNAPNSDNLGFDNDGKPILVANTFFPPVNGTATRGANGRVLVVDQDTLEVIDEYSMPTSGPFANDPRWNCPAGVLFTSEGLFVSMFHGDAVFVIDWRAGINEGRSSGVGSNSIDGEGGNQGNNGNGGGQGNGGGGNSGKSFALNDPENEAVVRRVIDLEDLDPADGNQAPDAPAYDSGHRRDNLRAIRMSEDGTLYGTRRSRSLPCAAGDAGCNPGAFRQHIFIVDPGESHNSGKTIGLDPGINVIAGVTINRMSTLACDAINPKDEFGVRPSLDACDVETLYVGVSAANPGCVDFGPKPPNRCFAPVAHGALLEYMIDADHLDGGAAWGGGACTGAPNLAGADGCALPIVRYSFINRGDSGPSAVPVGFEETLDPRMVMTVHEAFVQ